MKQNMLQGRQGVITQNIFGFVDILRLLTVVLLLAILIHVLMESLYQRYAMLQCTVAQYQRSMQSNHIQ